VSEPRTTWGLIRYFLFLGSLGFGGPVALIGYMQRDLVERRGWFTKEEYLKGLALSQLAPGPLAAQLAICLGYTHGRVWGATAVGIAFIAPSFLMTVALGALYVAYGGLSGMQAAFYGVGAAVIGIIVRSAWKLGTMTMAGDRLLWGIFAVMGLHHRPAHCRAGRGTLLLLSRVKIPEPILIVAASLIGILVFWLKGHP
jgi:chromate transporter